MVRLYALGHCEQEGTVGVVSWFVQDGEVGRPFVGASQVLAMAFGTVGRVEVGASGNKSGILWFDVGVRSDNTCSEQEQD
jgi:hypothetical protein